MHFLQSGANSGEAGLLLGSTVSRTDPPGATASDRLRGAAAQGLFSPLAAAHEFGLDIRPRGSSTRSSVEGAALAIDSLDGFRQASPTGRTIRYMTASERARARGITVLLSDETLKPSGPEMEMRIQGMSALVENLLLLEYVTISTRLRRLLAVVKQRGSLQAAFMREFHLTVQGMVVAADATSAEEVMARADELHTRRSRKPGRRRGSDQAECLRPPARWDEYSARRF